MDAPSFRVLPPVALGVPLVVGWILSAGLGEPVALPEPLRWAGWFLITAFIGWNGWALLLMGRHRTGLLPGEATTVLLEAGPFARSRNPLYVGLLALYAGLALVTGSVWALVLAPVAFAALLWGAVLPEERYLRAKFGAEYDDYTRRVRRWL